MTQRKKWLDVVILVVCAVAMVLAGGSAWFGQRADSKQTDCLNRFANQMADALDARTQASEPRDKAEAHIFRVVYLIGQRQATREDFEKALTDYVKADDKLTQERARTPYPDPPREVCPRG